MKCASSFNLDNTLEYGGDHIHSRMMVTAASLNEHSIEQPRRVEQIMGDLF
jgi:hypothetical protein